jgi:putative nucleotidyltransferase with HDIG domain
LFLSLAGTIAVYYLTAALLTILIRTSAGGDLRRLVGTLGHPLYLAVFCVLGLSTILLVPVYFQLGVAGLLLGLLPLCVFFYAVRLYLRMRDVYRQALRALVGSIEAMDPYTHGHSDRVAGLCIEVGRRLGFSENRLRLLEYAAYLHDMGKVTIDPAILHKKGSLTEVEWVVIRSHPSEGAEILKPVGFLHKILPWIAHHHEKADGTGYPGALPLERTPLEARIISAADAFDAMISDRPYRAPLSIEETVLEMRRNQNTQFDAQIVGIICQLVASADFVRWWRERRPL